MDSIRERLDQDLRAVESRLHRWGGTVAVEELTGAAGVDGSLADEVDGIQANETREIGFATRELLIGRVNRLAAALDRMSKGEYGVCLECGQPIPATRLRAMPEVPTCVGCQGGLERFGRGRKGRRESLVTGAEDGVLGAGFLASVRALYLPNEEDRDGASTRLLSWGRSPRPLPPADRGMARP